jgi:hypothetical protein
MRIPLPKPPPPPQKLTTRPTLPAQWAATLSHSARHGSSQRPRHTPVHSSFLFRVCSSTPANRAQAPTRRMTGRFTRKGPAATHFRARRGHFCLSRCRERMTGFIRMCSSHDPVLRFQLSSAVGWPDAYRARNGPMPGLHPASAAEPCVIVRQPDTGCGSTRLVEPSIQSGGVMPPSLSCCSEYRRRPVPDRSRPKPSSRAIAGLCACWGLSSSLDRSSRDKNRSRLPDSVFRPARRQNLSGDCSFFVPFCLH